MNTCDSDVFQRCSEIEHELSEALQIKAAADSKLKSVSAECARSTEVLTMTQQV